MIAENYIRKFKERFGDQIMCSDNYMEAKRDFRDELFLSEKYCEKNNWHTRYRETYPTDIKRLNTDIPYRDAQAMVKTKSSHEILWSLPSRKNSIVFSDPDNDPVAFQMQMHYYVIDCVIWSRIIHTNDARLCTGKPTENLLCWLFFKYVNLYCKRNGAGKWTTNVPYNKILDSLLGCVKQYVWIPGDDFHDAIRRMYEPQIRQRNLANYKDRYKKKDGDVYVLKSEDNFKDNKHSNSATCRAKYNDEEMAIIGNLELGRNEAARRLKELGYNICPSTISNVRKRLQTAKEKEYEEKQRTRYVGPLGF